MTTEIEIKDNEFLRQFEFQHDDQMARIEYSLQERKIFLTKFEMPEEMLNKGLAEPFMEAVFSEIKDRKISLVPTCSEVTHFIRRNRRTARNAAGPETPGDWENRKGLLTERFGPHGEAALVGRRPSGRRPPVPAE
jgi:predicted GNAT family acetyltransferase